MRGRPERGWGGPGAAGALKMRLRSASSCGSRALAAMAPRREAALLLLLLFVLPPASAELSSYFGTKSRYEEVNPHLLSDPLSLGPAAGGSLPASCTPLQLRAVLRHGTRYPTAGQVRRLAVLHNRLLRWAAEAAACPAAVALADWPMWYNESLDGQLAQQGWRDMELLARRMAARFPALFAARRRLALASSSKPRCRQSGIAFRRGLGPTLDFGGDGECTTPTPTLGEPLAFPGRLRDSQHSRGNGGVLCPLSGRSRRSLETCSLRGGGIPVP